MDTTADLSARLTPLITPSVAPGARAISAFSEPDKVPVAVESTSPPVVDWIDEANAALALRQTGLRFVQQAALPRAVIQIIDETSGEVLKQIPNEAAVRMAEALTGLLVDRHA